MLSAVEEPKVSVSEAMDIYQTKIAPPLLVKKSPEQKRRWKATKDLSLKYFVDMIGDLAMTDITREHGQKYYDFWNGEVSPSDPAAKPKQPKTADRHFGDIRRLYADYFKHVGDETRLNPFRNLTFKDRRNRGTRKYPPFADKWVREKILVPGWYERLTDEMFLAPLMINARNCSKSRTAFRKRLPRFRRRARSIGEARSVVDHPNIYAGFRTISPRLLNDARGAAGIFYRNLLANACPGLNLTLCANQHLRPRNATSGGEVGHLIQSRRKP